MAIEVPQNEEISGGEEWMEKRSRLCYSSEISE